MWKLVTGTITGRNQLEVSCLRDFDAFDVCKLTFPIMLLKRPIFIC